MDDLAVSMYLSQEAKGKFFSGDPDTIEMNSTEFSDVVVPFAYQSNDNNIALKKYARAYVKEGGPVGPPAFLVTLIIPVKDALQHFMDVDIEVMDRPEETVGFHKVVNRRNFPNMQVQLTPITAEESGVLLQKGVQLLRKRRS